MNAMVPPKGAVPVGMVKVLRGRISGSVTYTGTVQSFEDEDIYPRITGRIVSMPVYPGDRVRKGQLLIQLDPAGQSEYQAKQEEASSAADAAMHNAGIARMEYEQKNYEFKAAREAEDAAKQAVNEAQANAEYWKPELERQSALLKAQVVSLDEYQKEAAEARSAEAKLQQAMAKLREATNTRLAAKTALDTMLHHIGHQAAAAQQASAAARNAAIYENYTLIMAQSDGVVTKRLISPGVVVSPGMLILKVAHLGKARIQAQVASDDAERIRVGNRVDIQSSENARKALQAKITSIFPAADPTSRTVTVEALINNVAIPQAGSGIPQNLFVPGEYVIMRIETGDETGLTIPTSAVIWRGGKTQVWKASVQATNQANAKTYACIMHPEIVSDKPGSCPKCAMKLVPKEAGGPLTAQLVDIQVGIGNPDTTEVKSGLSQGDQVVSAGYANLQPGVPIIATDWGTDGPAKLPLASDVASNRIDASNNWKNQQTLGAYNLEVSLSPAKASSNSIVVKLVDSKGGGVSGATIRARTSMPGMNMPGPDLNVSTANNGEASSKTDFMSGLWRIELTVSTPGGEPLRSVLDIEVP